MTISHDKCGLLAASLFCSACFVYSARPVLADDGQEPTTPERLQSEASKIAEGALDEGQHAKTIDDDLIPGDVIAICSQFVKWNSDANGNARMDPGEVSKFSFQKNEYVALIDKEFDWIVDWAYQDLEHRGWATEYKRIGDRPLHMLITYPEGWQKTDKRPVALFFFGGGFNQGNYFGGKHRAKYYNSLGVVYALVDYRVQSRDGKDTDGGSEKLRRAFEDCKDAVIWIRENAESLGIDSQKLICCGSSAGTMVKELYWQNDPQLRPNALVLQVPYRGTKSLEEIRNNLNNMTKSMPPTICFAAGKDRISHPFAKNYAEAIVAGGGIAETIVYEDEAHVLSNKVYADMHEKSKEFLIRVGILDEQVSE